MKIVRLIAALLLLAAPAARAQNVPVYATGFLTPGHLPVLAPTGFPGSAVVQDAGPALAGNITELGITNNGAPLCVRDLAGQHILCLGALANGGALISYNPIGSGTPLGLNFNINGVDYPFPEGAGNGNVIGPTSPTPTSGHVAIWNGGLNIIDGGPYGPTTINVIANCGAVGNGTTDDTAAIQSCINSLPPAGGIITFPANHTYLVTSTLTIGNGSASAASTQTGVMLIGQANPNGPPYFGFNATQGPQIKWGGSGAPVISVRGPLSGWGVQNLYVNCQSISGAIGLQVVSAQLGDSKNLSFVNCQGSLISTVVASAPAGVGNTDSLHNAYRNVAILMPAIAASVGLELSGNNNSNTDYNDISNFVIAMPSASGAVAVDIAASDSNVLRDIHVTDCTTGGTAFQFDYSINSGWPAGNTLFGIDPGGTCPGGAAFANNGVPGAASRNFVYGMSGTNGAVPAGLENLVFADGPWIAYTPTLSCGSGTLTSATATGLYAVVGNTVNIEIQANITTNGSCAGTLNATLPAIFPAATVGAYILAGYETTTAFAGVGFINPSVSTILVKASKYDGTYPVTSSDAYVLSGAYQTTN
jgi:hypothetical protein